MRRMGRTARMLAALVAAATLFAARDAAAGQGVSRFVTEPGEAGSAPENLCVAGDSLYFAADDGVHGKELWRIDIDGAPHFVGDFRPGPEGSLPRSLVAVDDRLCFVGLRQNYQFGELLEYVWQTRGTAATTRCLRLPPSAQAQPGDATLVALAGSVYGAQSSPNRGRELAWFDKPRMWDTTPGQESGVPREQEYFATLGSRLLFTTQLTDVSSRSLRVLETAPGQERHEVGFLTGQGKTGIGFSIHCRVANGALWFCGSTEHLGMELCVTDGTPEGTRLVRDIHPGVGDSNPKDFAAHRGIVYFQANDGEHGTELWRTDGTEAGTWLVKDLNPGPWDSNPYHMRSIGSCLLFAARSEEEGTELWRTDGTAEGTELVRDIFPGADGSDLYQPTVYGDLLLFAAEHPEYGEELWRSDGTAEGTRLVREIHPGPGDAEPYYLTLFRDQVYFTANDGVHGEEVWCSDGTPEGTALAADIRPATRIVRSGNPTHLAADAAHVYFAADDLRHGNELWHSDVSTLETRMAADIRPGAEGSNPEELVFFEGVLFFTADDGAHGREIWRSEGAGEVRLAADVLEGGAGSNPRLLTPSGAGLFLAARGPGEGDALYHLAGPDAEPARIDTPGVPGGPLRVENLVLCDERLYLCLRGPDRPFRFAVLDTVAMRLEALPFEISEPVSWEGLPAVRGAPEGNAAGAHLLQSYFSLPGMRRRAARLGDRWYFAARDGRHGAELWSSRGDVESAALLYECCPGIASGSPGEFRVAGGELFFAADRPGRGRELWTTNGAPEGTHVVHDWPGQTMRGAGPRHLTPHGGALFYSAPGSGWYAERRALTKCERTPNGLFVTTAAEPDRHWPDNPGEFVSAGDWLYFAADHPATGRELWRYGEPLYRSAGGAMRKLTVYTMVCNIGREQCYALDAEITGRTWHSAP